MESESSNNISSEEDSYSHLKILDLMKTNNIEYSLLVHKPTRTSEESALVRGVSLASGAKAMLIKLSSSSILFKLIVLSAACKVNWKLVKNVLKTKKVDLASEEEVKYLTKCLPGAVPPFGSIYGIETLIDQSIISQGDSINFNAGLRTHSLGIKTKDYLNVEKGTIVDIATKN